jgi:hypothetical protein
MAKLKDMTGQRFTRLLVVSRATSDSNGNARWNCACDCGAQTVTSGFTLRNGEAKSCGCLTAEQLTERSTKHGMHGTPEYVSWASMIQRCTNPRTVKYHRYGGRGIKVCEAWLNSFEQFYADMGPRPSEQHSIERDNTDGHYEPKNCRWATTKEQNNNTSQNRIVTIDGHAQTLATAVSASPHGLLRGTVQSRLHRGWSEEDAVKTPKLKSRAHDLEGQKFARLTVVCRVENAGKYARWLCVCECGTEREIYATSLVHGTTKSCGCISKELLQTPGRISRKRKPKPPTA